MYPNLTLRSVELFERAQHSMPGGNTRTTVYSRPYPIYAKKAQGCHIEDVDGHEIIDCLNNFTALIHGHAHPHIVEAITQAARRGSAFGMPTEAEIHLAEILTGRVSSIETIRFTNSGTEAVMMAIKGARAYTNRFKLAKLEGAYHGAYDYAEVSLAAGPNSWGDMTHPRAVPYAKGTPRGILDDVVVLPFNDVEATRKLLLENRDSLAAVLVDPIPNRVGLIRATDAYLQMLRKVTHEIGAVFILDEVISLRLAKGGAQSICHIEPDLTIMGKIIGGGMPVGAFGGRREIMSVFDPSSGHPLVSHGGTFTANTVTMEAGIASMELLDDAAFKHLDATGTLLRAGLQRVLNDLYVPGQVTGVGSLARIHLKTRPLHNYRDTFSTSAEHDCMELLHNILISEGVLMAHYGLLSTSTPMSDEDIHTVVNRFHDALSVLLRTDTWGEFTEDKGASKGGV